MSSEELHQSPFEARPAQALPRRRLQFPDSAPQQYSSSESLNPQINGSTRDRRRVVSVDAKYGYPGVAAAKPRRRPVSLIGTVPETAREGNTSTSADDLSLGTFSDEYDLSHEDPRLIQEVQRAIKLKARRDARSRASPAGQATLRSQASSRSSLPHAVQFNLMPPPMNVSADIDFSPSTSAGAKSDVTNAHPVPTSLDSGSTLDWSIHPTQEEEKEDKKWTLSLSRKKGKEKDTLVSQSELLKQENQFVENLQRIRSGSSPQTLHKAAITHEQLGRRYSYLKYASRHTNSNLLEIARWYGSQSDGTRNAMEQAQPFAWLKHLDKGKPKEWTRPPWNLTALTLDQFTRAHNIHSISEEPTSPRSSPRTSHSIPSQTAPFSFPSRSASRFSLKPSLNQRLSPENGRVSFEPLIESLRGSLDQRSRRSFDSTYSSTYSSASGVPQASPVALKPPPSDSEASSARQSSSEGGSHGKKPGRYPVLDTDQPAENPRIRISFSRAQSVEPGSPGLPDVPFNVIPPSDEGTPDLEVRSTVSKPSSTPRHRELPRRILARRSLPSTRKESLDSQQRDANFERTRREYEQKAQLLEATMTQNSRLRQLLHRVAGNVKEYENVQSNISRALGLPYKSLPQEVVDAFSHDPAAVTGSTRRLRGYQAVDDIHKRLQRQQETLRSYLCQSGHLGRLETSESIFDSSISTLLTTIAALEGHRHEILDQTRNVTDVLQRVQVLHGETKADYNAALAHTSVAYPELSTIVALEESYRDQYQQFWELGMDFLTFLLDTVTPFWRTYGKTIGDDVMEFLIIPLYRNEFTGESKRYPIKSLPRRSFMHWVSQIMFFSLSATVAIFQISLALSSTAHFRLEVIGHQGLRYVALPLFWILIIIQWVAGLTEIAIVLTQLGVVCWWICWFVRLVD